MVDFNSNFVEAVKMANLNNSADFNLKGLDKEKIRKTLEDFKNKYITHDKGFFILAPSGTGKTHFCKHQIQPDWIDGDDLWMASEAHPSREWWLEGIPLIDEVDKRSDVVTALALKNGYWIMGASNNWIKPDALIIPDWEEHKKLIKYREENNYDGGAKSDRLDQVLSSRKWMSRWIEKGTPVFKTVKEAVDYLLNN